MLGYNLIQAKIDKNMLLVPNILQREPIRRGNDSKYVVHEIL